MCVRIFLGLCASLLLSAPLLAEPIPIDDVVVPDGMTAASLSPDGRHIAAIIFNGTNHGLVLVDTATQQARTIMQGKRGHVGLWDYFKAPRSVSWAGNEILVIDYGLEVESLDLDGKRIKTLGERTIGPAGYGNANFTKILVFEDVGDGEIALCDARSGKCERFNTPPGKPVKWAFDKKGNLRAVSMLNSAFWKDVSTVTNWYRPGDREEWQKLAEFKITDDYWVPVYVPDEPGTLVINSRLGRDTYALFNYEVTQRRQGEMLAGHPVQDIISYKGIDQSAFNYVATGGMIPTQVWFDAAWARVQKTVDTVLPGRINVLSGDPGRSVLVRSYADVDPGTWYFFDILQKRMQQVGRVQSSVDPAKMRRMEVISYRADDGIEIPAYLTRPTPMKGAAPTVVLIHGGPIARDAWEWNPDVQILASRGYLVFQPQFRGSAGFGRKFEEAGYGQWGRSMQDDITAGVRHLIDQGLADPDRICIVGASYGGYAALWGLAKTPDLYRCGVSFAGVADIAYMFSDFSDRNLDKGSRELMLSRIGDRRMSHQLFDPVSPLLHAADIKAPVLLIHGEDDERVPVSHSKKMRDALERNNKRVRMITFDDEGHGLYYVKHQVEYYTELLKFLDENIGH